MSSDNTTPDKIERDDPMMAAEHALGLLEGEELLASRGKIASDPRYAWRKDWWDNWFAPWTDEVAGAEPGPDVWMRIEEEVRARRSARAEAELSGGGSAANVVDLTQRLRRWQWTAGLTSAAAAVLLAVVLFTPGLDPAPTPGATDTPVLASADPLVAQIPIGETGLRLDVTYIPESERLLVGAIGLTADGVHDHELWLVPEDGSALQSLGVVAPGEVRSVALSDEIARNLDAGVGLVLTREPIGGKPEGQDAGPVVAEGAFSAV
jgi:anti-sigma-K factor RskA